MKKCTLLCLVFFTLNTSFSIAQITIESEDMASVGKKFTLAFTRDSMIIPKFDTLNSLWNFTTLKTDTTRIIEAINTSWTPYANDFKESTIALKDNNSYQFIHLNSIELKAYGATVVNPLTNRLVKIKFAKPETPFKFPMETGKNFQSNSNYSFSIDTNFSINLGITINVVKVRISGKRSHVISCEKSGNLITPFDTLSSLLIKDYLIETDSIYITTKTIFGTNETLLPNNVIPGLSNPLIDTTTNYSWWAKKIGCAVLSFNYDNSKSTSASWLKELPVTSGIKEQMVKSTYLFPNPGNGNFILKSNSKNLNQLSIFSIEGKLQKTVTLFNNDSVIDLSILSTGLYYYQIIDRENNIVENKKLIIN